MPAGALARTPTHRPAITRRRIASRRRTRRRRLASVLLQSLRVSRPGHPFSAAIHHAHSSAANPNAAPAQTETYLQRAALSHTARMGKMPFFSALKPILERAPILVGAACMTRSPGHPSTLRLDSDNALMSSVCLGPVRGSPSQSVWMHWPPRAEYPCFPRPSARTAHGTAC